MQLVTEGRIVHRQVETGLRGQADGQIMVAVRGIDDGAMVVAGSVGTLRDGTAVRLAPVVASGGTPTAARSAP